MTAVEILLPAFAFALLLIATHVPFGLHVLARGIVFVDLALAQMAALGLSVGFALGFDPHGGAAFVFALIGALIAALGFALLRRVAGKTRREAIIGSVYVVAVGASLMILSGSGQGMEELKALLNGSILFVTWREIALVGALFAAILIVLALRHRRFAALSGPAPNTGPAFLWEAVFFVGFAAMVTVAVHIAGVLVVFAYLILPAFSATLLRADFRARLIAGYALAAIGTILGLLAAYAFDLPVGATLVTVLGALPIAAALLRRRPA